MIRLLRDFILRYRWVFAIAAVVAALPAPKDDIPPGTILAALGPILVLLETARGAARTRRTLPTSRLSLICAIWLEVVFLFPLLLTIMQTPNILFFSDLELTRRFAVLGTTLAGTMASAAVLYIFFRGIFEYMLDEHGRPLGNFALALIIPASIFWMPISHVARTFCAMSIEVANERFFETSERQLIMHQLDLFPLSDLSPALTLTIGSTVMMFAMLVSRTLALNMLVGQADKSKQKPNGDKRLTMKPRWKPAGVLLWEAWAAVLVFLTIGVAVFIVEGLISLNGLKSIYFDYIIPLFYPTAIIFIFMRTTIWYSSLRALKALPMSANRRTLTTFSLAVLAPGSIPFCVALVFNLSIRDPLFAEQVAGGLAFSLGIMAVLLGAGLVYLRFDATLVRVLGMLAITVGVPYVWAYLPLTSGVKMPIYAFVLAIELWWLRALILNFDDIYRRKPLWSGWLSN